MESRKAFAAPDCLQDLCVFYCMNHLDVFVSALKASDMSAASGGSFPVLLGNKLLDYYMRCSIPKYNLTFKHPDQSEVDLLDDLVSNGHTCNEISVIHGEKVSADIFHTLSSNNLFRTVELTSFDGDEIAGMKKVKCEIIKKSLKVLSSVKLNKLSDEEMFLEILCNLAGQSYLESESSSSEVAENTEDNFEDENMVALPLQVDINEQFTVANTKYKPTKLQPNCDRNTNAQKDDFRCVNLKSFTYNQYASNFDNMNEVVIRKFSLFVSALSEILENNLNLQTFCVTSALSYPLDWFLNLPFLPLLKNLQSLTLACVNVPNIRMEEMFAAPRHPDPLSMLPTLQNLRHLDISFWNRDGETCATYSRLQLKLFVEGLKSMPNLRSLDISGTNLQDIISHENGSSECEEHCMPGFQGRKFDFLGLYETEKCVCHHRFIPAYKVSGSGSEEQLIVALWSYQHSPNIMTHVLANIQELVVDSETTLKHPLALYEGLVAYMGKVGSWHTSQSRSTYGIDEGLYSSVYIMYFLLRKDVKRLLTIQHRRHMLENLLTIMWSVSQLTNWPQLVTDKRHKMMRISMLIILVLDLESVAVYSHRFEQYVQVLVQVNMGFCRSTQRQLVLRLLHSACRVSQEHKAIIGQKLGLVQALLKYIEPWSINGKNVLMEVLEKYWSILWTLTDEVPVNCHLFMQYGGCEIGRKCIELFNVNDLRRKITGAISNVSENFELHPLLMTREVVVLFRDMLKYASESDYDVSSHAASFLVQLASSGPEHWMLAEPSWETILKEVDEAIQKWDINGPKGVKFRSLLPMLRQVGNQEVGVAQLWAAWGICNLIIVKPSRYFAMLEREGGLKVMSDALENPGIRDDVASLITDILNRHTRWSDADHSIDEDD
ncbi:protein zer-1 homolog [Mya arenaria]|uniref:protein zer-1 homolog n=1 Tax=Mya arenaria TaxID=6604 RepID=UPI0022E9798C|nr:protein zer-1 homolog [Mya arenaria]